MLGTPPAPSPPDWWSYLPYLWMGLVGACGAIARGIEIKSGVKVITEFATVIFLCSIVNYFGDLWNITIGGKIMAAGVACWLGPGPVVDMVMSAFSKWRAPNATKP